MRFQIPVPTISILVPCYNIEKYIDAAMESLLSQTFTDFEIIALNDGSTDGTLEHLKRCEERDSRVRIIDKPNSGYGATMNLGLDLARGRYLAILESDDIATPDFLSANFQLAEASGADATFGRFMTFGEGMADEVSRSFKQFIGREDHPYIRSRLLRRSLAIWAGLYRRDWLLQQGIRFQETPGASFQDASFTFKVRLNARRRLHDTVLVHYRQHPNNSVKSTHKGVFLFKELDACKAALKKARFSISPAAFLHYEFDSLKWYALILQGDARKDFVKQWAQRWRTTPAPSLVYLRMRWTYEYITRYPDRFLQDLEPES